MAANFWLMGAAAFMNSAQISAGVFSARKPKKYFFAIHLAGENRMLKQVETEVLDAFKELESSNNS